MNQKDRRRRDEGVSELRQLQPLRLTWPKHFIC